MGREKAKAKAAGDRQAGGGYSIIINHYAG